MTRRECEPECDPGQLLCCSYECETIELERRRRAREGWESAEDVARKALIEHLITTGSLLNPGGVKCMCGNHVAHTVAERSNHKADSIVTALRRAGRLLE